MASTRTPCRRAWRSPSNWAAYAGPGRWPTRAAGSTWTPRRSAWGPPRETRLRTLRGTRQPHAGEAAQARARLSRVHAAGGPGRTAGAGAAENAGRRPVQSVRLRSPPVRRRLRDAVESPGRGDIGRRRHRPWRAGQDAGHAADPGTGVQPADGLLLPWRRRRALGDPLRGEQHL